MNFEYIRKLTKFFLPKTPFAALKGMKSGILPPEAFIYKATSLKPIFEKPYDLEELDRILARQDLQLNTIVALMEIFKELIQEEDPEIALFAAESINIIEQRYIDSIDKVKENSQPEERLYELGRIYYEMAILSYDVPTIMAFYLDQAVGFLEELMQIRDFTSRESGLYCRILFRRKNYKKIVQFIKDPPIGYRGTKEHILQAAELLFKTGNYFKVLPALNKIKEPLNETEELMVQSWRGSFEKKD